MKTLLEIKNGIPRHPLYRMKEPVNLTINYGEQLAIVGLNGSGKSRLVDILTGRWPMPEEAMTYNFGADAPKMMSDNIKYIAFRDTYGDGESSYYQQRWNSTALDELPIVKDLLPPTDNSELQERLFALFGLEGLLEKAIITLSSGEMRKFQLTKALLGSPRLLILDNPFIGLDATTRDLLHRLLEDIVQQLSIHIILILAKSDDIPQFITHVLPISGLICGNKIPKSDYHYISYKEVDHILPEETEKQIARIENKSFDFKGNEIVKLNQVSIRYNERTILKELDWTIKRGEKWALSGENGAGKSTLLSLVCADNPQSYACNIELFGRKRGSGESIWDIKRHIGYVSPEMHRAYKKNIPAVEIVGSGLYDTVGLYKTMRPEDKEVCEQWLNIFGVAGLSATPFLQLSSGEQRLVLLARAFVKDPALLILDEPLHGLDLKNRKLVKEIIEAFCHRKDKTLIMITHYEEELPGCITHRKHLKKNV